MKRTASIDLLRGFIMIFMALDHASAMIARVHFSEFWGIYFAGYPSLAWWFTRFISHLCAPGFFLLMGFSITLFATKRSTASWPASKINYYFFKRGGIILLFMLLLEFPAWGLSMLFSEVPSVKAAIGANQEGFAFPTTVLFGLGMCMMIGGLLWRAKGWQLLSISVFSIVLSSWYIAHSNTQLFFNPLEQLFLVPGTSPGIKTLYPVFPWLGISTFGMFLAQQMLNRKEKFFSFAFGLGLAFLALFALLRALHMGNFQMNAYDDWISFFTLVKYPASLTFILVTCGLNLVILSLFSKVEGQGWLKPVLVFGQTAMFFYIVHLYLYALLGALFPKGCSIEIMYALWLLGLLLLFFICRKFLPFKQQQPMNSFWRMV
jgi:uncharacterized membrane protein